MKVKEHFVENIIDLYGEGGGVYFLILEFLSLLFIYIVNLLFSGICGLPIINRTVSIPCNYY